MQLNVAKEIAATQRMTMKDPKASYAGAFGESSPDLTWGNTDRGSRRTLVA